jgi:PIN domain nuclease of toxin-antitoxin system
VLPVFNGRILPIKAGFGRADFVIEPRFLRRGLLENGYQELPVRSAHAVAVGELPAWHRELFDRLLVAQAQIEDVTLMMSDAARAAYPGPILKV